MKRSLFVLAVLLWSISASAQVSAPITIIVQDEGATAGQVRVINCVGAGVVCTVSGSTGTLTISGGGTVSATQVEIDFDTCGDGSATSKYTCSVAVTDANVSATSKIIASQDGVAATSRQADENELTPLDCNTRSATGSFTLICTSRDGPTHGKFKINYVIG